MRRVLRPFLRALAALALLALLAAAWLWHVNFNDGVPVEDAAPPRGEPALLIERGAYLARIGNCLGCHTARGGAPAAGGVPIATPFGTAYSSNLTPDREAGIGGWTAAAFWRALHHGRSADGRLLLPAFPYTHTTLLTREDADALFSYLQSLPAAPARVPAHALRWPFGTPVAQAVWRALYFRAEAFTPEPAQGDAWNRGAYLVRAVAHCSACHATRDGLQGGDWRDLSGNLLPSGWYAPSLTAAAEAGVASWSEAEIARLLQSGIAAAGTASGPMAEIVFHGTQYLTDADARAIAVYLKSLPPSPAPAPRGTPASASRLMTAGARIYEQQCADCHGTRGEGVAGAYPALAGNRAVSLARTENLLQMVLHGGFAAATAGHPRPYGMPPFAQTLGDEEIAAVLSFVRGSWGHRAGDVTPVEVTRLRAAFAASP